MTGSLKRRVANTKLFLVNKMGLFQTVELFASVLSWCIWKDETGVSNSIDLDTFASNCGVDQQFVFSYFK